MTPPGPPFSVALATYNGERYLAEQLASVAAQTRPPAELVACDDGSTDGTPGVLRAFAEAAPFPVRVYGGAQGRPLGYADNFLRAVERCRSPWVALCDQDDVWRPGKLAALAEATRTPGAVLVTHSADLVDGDLRPAGGRLPDHRRRRVAGPLEGRPLGFLWGFSCAFDRALLAGVPLDGRPPDYGDPGRPAAHDQLVGLLAHALGTTVYLPDALALYRRHDRAVTGGTGAGGLLAGAATHASVGRADYDRYAGVADASAAFLARVDAQGDAARAARLGRAVGYYAAYAEALRARGRLHDRTRGRLARGRSWARMVARGDYRRVGGGAGLGAGALAKDLVLGVLR